MDITEIFIFFMLTLLFVRIIGILVFVDLYNKLKLERLKIATYGWMIYSLAPLFAIISTVGDNVLLNDFVYTLYGICASLGSFIIIGGLVRYYREIRQNLFTLIQLGMLIIPILLFGIYQNTSGAAFSVFTQFLILLFITGDVILNNKKFRDIGGNSYIWLTLMLLIGISQSIIYLFLDIGVEEATIMNYGLTIVLSSTVIIFFIQLEHQIALKEKFNLKDKFSHNLTQFHQLILGNIELALLSNNKEKDCEKFLLIAKENSIKSRNLLHEIKKL